MVESERIKVLENEISKEYGDFKVTGYRHEKGKVDFLQCECKECGRTRSIRFSQIKPIECRHGVKNVYDESYIGKKKNRLTVVEVKQGRFICRCDCGNVIQTTPSAWNFGQIKSCGCLSQEARVEHTPELDRLRIIYNGMMQRCNNPKATNYECYGGRGINICQEWQDDFNKFAEWALSHGYEDGLTIDRTNNDGNYEPGNCHWATAKEQAQNQRPKRGGHLYRGKYRTQAEIAKILHMPDTTLSGWIKKGMSMEKIEREAVRIYANN